MNENYTIYDVIRGLSAKRKIYLKYRFQLWTERDIIPKNEDELIKKMKLKSKDSLQSYRKWEQSEEFKHIVALILQSRQAEDLENMYNRVKEKAMSDDATTKDIDMMIKLSNIIEERHKQAQDYFAYVLDEIEDDE